MSVAGFDACKASLTMYHQGTGKEVPNRSKEILRALKELPEDAAVAVEATGRLHLALARAAFKLGLKVYVLNPRDAKAWRDYLGRRAKTDKVDAKEIAQYLEAFADKLVPWVPQEAKVGLVRDLLCARAAIVRSLVSLQQSYSELCP